MKRILTAVAMAVCLLGGSMVYAGAVGGPKVQVTSVRAYSNDVFKVYFHAWEQATVVVRGDGDTDLDLFVYDENGNLVASDTGVTDDCEVRWVPKWTGLFYIKVVNRGPVSNTYVIQTN
jgi:hypothetical protein